MPENGDPLLLPQHTNAAGFTFSIGMGSVAIMSMIGDIVDENELLTGERQEGLLFSRSQSIQLRRPFLCRSYAGVLRAATRASDPR